MRSATGSSFQGFVALGSFSVHAALSAGFIWGVAVLENERRGVKLSSFSLGSDD